MTLKLLPKIYYDLAIKNEKSMPVIFTDILIRMKVKIDKKELTDMIFSYLMLENETPEIISYKFYNTMDYNWVIMFINNKFDYINDFPLSEQALLKFCVSKYGVDNVYETHHYEDAHSNTVDEYYYDYNGDSGAVKTGVLAQEPIWKTFSTDTQTLLKTNTGKVVTNYEYEEKLNESKRNIFLIKPSYINQFVKKYETALKEIIE